MENGVEPLLAYPPAERTGLFPTPTVRPVLLMHGAPAPRSTGLKVARARKRSFLAS